MQAAPLDSLSCKSEEQNLTDAYIWRSITPPNLAGVRSACVRLLPLPPSLQLSELLPAARPTGHVQPAITWYVAKLEMGSRVAPVEQKMQLDDHK